MQAQICYMTETKCMNSYIDHSLYFPLDVIPLHFSICPQPSGTGTLKHSEQIIPFIRRNL
jgi:hypothetical protein